ncbi:MAG: ATP-binding cassette domain-containing protein [Ilumatobacteraceae bacterium]
MRHRLLITEPGSQARVLDIDGTVDVGRDATAIVLSDPAVSRLHARLDATGPWLTVADLGSAYGTFVNGVRISEPTPLSVASSIRVGDSQLLVLPAGHDETGPLLDELSGSGVLVRFRRGAAAAASAAQVLAQATAARSALAGLGTEPSLPAVTIRLVDYLPGRTGGILRSGFAVDHVANTVYLVCTAEAPPAHPAATLAVLFAVSPPPDGDVDDRAMLIAEGLGLSRAGAADSATLLDGRDDATVDRPPAELREAVAASWARFLVRRDGEKAVTALLHDGGADFDGRFRIEFGRSFSQLADDWEEEVVDGAGTPVAVSAFARLSLSLLRPYKWRQLEVFGYMLFSLAFGAAYPFVSRALIDTAIPSGEWAQVFTLLLVLGGAFVVSVVASIRESYQSTHISGAVVNDLRSQIYDRVQDLPMSWFASRSQGEVLSRLFSDVGAVQSSLTQAIGTGIFQTLSLVVSSVILMTLEWRLGLIVLLGAPLVALIYRSMSEGARAKSMTVHEDSSTMFTIAAENYQAQTVVKVFDLGDHERSRFQRASDRLFRSQKRMALYSELFGASVNVFVTVLRLVVMGVGAWMIFDGSFSIGGLVAFLGVVGEVLGPVTGLVGLGQSFQEASGALTRVQEIRGLQPERPDDPQRLQLAPFADRIELRDVSFLYNGRHLALDGIDLTIRAGERVAFVGRSGSGKSTLMRLLMRLDEPTSGSLRVDGVELGTTRLRDWRSQLGVVMQESFLFDVTLQENIALGMPGATDEAVRQAARTAEVDEFVSRLPRGYETMVGERGGALSGGQRQRVAIARALVRDPRVLLLDEATSALDPQTERQIAATLARAGRHRTTIAVTHRLAAVADFDTIVVIDAGRIVERGAHGALLALGGVYAGLWAEQQTMAAVDSFDGVAALTRVSLFADQDLPLLRQLAESMQYVRLEAGDRMPEGDRLAFVASGSADVEVPMSGAGIATARLQPGDAFGLARAFGADSNSELVALEPTTVAVLAGTTWRELVSTG